MKHLWEDRRMAIAFYAITILGAAMAVKGVDTSMAIAVASGAVGVCNSYEKAQKALAEAKAKLTK